MPEPIQDTPMERASVALADLCGETWDESHQDDARAILTQAVNDRDGLAEALWKNDVPTIPWRTLNDSERAVYRSMADVVIRWLTQ